MTGFVCAVDVGTRSARAGLFDGQGHLLAREVEPLQLHEPGARIAEYASDAIWDAVCMAVRRLVSRAGVPSGDIVGLAFDATCSLVLRDRDGHPLRLGPEGRDTIAWCDHRGAQEAGICTDTGHPLISVMGGAMSPEMQTPKLLWLKRHRPDLWERLGGAADLTDHLTQRATGRAVLSRCTVTAKWPYIADAGGWQQDFLDQLGLGDVRARANLSERAAGVGTLAGGLTPVAAASLGLPAGLSVAVGMIDAFAGALGTMGIGRTGPKVTRLNLIAGTSACLMAISPKPFFAKGIWGPFGGAILSDHWVSEGGQSAAGALLDHVLDMWPGREAPLRHSVVLDRLGELRRSHGPGFARDIQILPDFHGNRSPFGDAHARGVIHGLTMDRGFDALCALYWRTAVALALGTRQIHAQMERAGLSAQSLTMSGGMARSPLLVQLYADVLGRPILRPGAVDGVLLGTAMAAAVAAGMHGDLSRAARAMAPRAQTFTPDPGAQAAYEKDWTVFTLMQQQRRDLTDLVARQGAASALPQGKDMPCPD